MKTKEEMKQEMREEMGDMVLAVKVAKVAMDHAEPGSGDLMVEILLEEIGKLHSDYGKKLTECCGVDRNDFEERTVREAGPYEGDPSTPLCSAQDDSERGSEENEVCENDTCDPFESSGLTFGRALEAAKRGARIARKGWNGKSQYVFLAKDFAFATDADLSAYEETGIVVHDALAIKTSAEQIQIGWLASQADMLSNDWYVAV